MNICSVCVLFVSCGLLDLVTLVENDRLVGPVLGHPQFLRRMLSHGLDLNDLITLHERLNHIVALCLQQSDCSIVVSIVGAGGDALDLRLSLLLTQLVTLVEFSA